jgi:predicted RNA-binding protein with PUA-like domain
VDVKATHRFAVPLTRAVLASEPKLKDMLVMKRGMRLSILPVTATEFQVIKALGKPTAVGRK